MTDTPSDAAVIADAWARLRRFTPARIALGRAGTSAPSDVQLAFQFAHARARDAVHHPLATDALRAQLAERGHTAATVRSAASDRRTYLQRPDLGRRLDEASRATLAPLRAPEHAPFDIAIVIADGLSAFAIEQNALPFLDAMLPRLPASAWDPAPLVIAEQSRVALGDDIAVALHARMVAILIGERPGLSSPDSMGIYLTWQPRVGTTDAQRNCISNIRRDGLRVELAADKLLWLMNEARSRRMSGVALKDDAQVPHEHLAAPTSNFLLES